MKTFNWFALLSAIAVTAGCASSPSLPSLPPVSPSVGPTTADTSNLPNDTRDAVDAAARLANLDSDNDSIPDSDDACGDTDTRVMVDLFGCELALGPVEGLGFGPGQQSLNTQAKQVLDSYIEALSRYPEVVVSVEAHTDNRGTAAANLELSKERVLSVVRYMVSGGISADRIKPFGYGESRPRAANATAEGREQNRRIEIKVLEGIS